MRRAFLLTIFLLLPATAFAHTGVGDTAGVAHGFMHPLSGADHVLAMVAVGVLAARWGGHALWLLPASFLAAMAAGGALGMAGVSVPFVEIGIGTSVVVLGVLIAVNARLPLVLACLLVGAFAVAHGFAHGSEMPATGSGLAYGLGFVVATAALHAAGIGVGLAVGRLGALHRRVAQVAGAAMSLAGVAILSGAL